MTSESELVPDLSDVSDVALLDLIDGLLDKGCVLTGELVLGLANIDLIYAELRLLLCAADRLLPREETV